MKDIFKGKVSGNDMTGSGPEIKHATLQDQLGLKSFGLYAYNMVWELRDHFEMESSDSHVLFRSLEDGSELELSCVKKNPAGQWYKVKLREDFSADPPYETTINGIPLSDVENKIIEHFTFWALNHYKGDDKKWDDAIDSACCQVSTINGQPSWGLQPL